MMTFACLSFLNAGGIGARFDSYFSDKNGNSFQLMAKDSSMKDESHGGHHAIRHITRQKKIIIINQEQELKRLRILVVTLSESSTVHVVSFLN